MVKLLAMVVVVLGWGLMARGEVVMVKVGEEVAAGRVKATAARVERVGGVGDGVRVRTEVSQGWPGVGFVALGGKWDLAEWEFVEVGVKNVGEGAVTVYCRVDNPGADGVKNCCNGSVQLSAGKEGVLRVRLARTSEIGGKLFGMRGYPAGFDPKGTLDVSNITQVLVFVSQPKAEHVFEIRDVRAGGKYEAAKVGVGEFFPFIDEFGQYVHRDWVGKVHSAEELAAKRVEEEKELSQRAGPEGWDKWGGWKDGPGLEAKGCFRVEKVNGKWWLVDPDGKLFFSHGVDCVRMLDITPIEGREGWFKDFPGERAEFKEFAVEGAFALHGHYAGKRPRSFGFAGANLKRKYGGNWREATAEVAHRRLRSWGLNTIGNWSEASVYMKGKTAYVCTLGSGRKMIEGSQGYWGKFPDVFDVEWVAETQRRIAAGAGRTGNDPWCIGYFVDNEMSWGDEVSLGVGALASPAGQAAKKVLVGDLKAKYGEIGKLNEVWGTKYGSWEGMLESRERLGNLTTGGKARGDLVDFYRKTAEEYFRVVKGAVKVAAPGRLYLGCRFAWANAVAVGAAGKYCDVVSYNLYQRSVAEFELPGGLDVPLMIGEFHFGALDRGMFHTGLVETGSQAERAKAYKDYVMGCLRHRQFVGCHWFQWQDEPVTGRVYDEENYQIGLVDGVDTPYVETIEAVREVGWGMYGK